MKIDLLNNNQTAAVSTEYFDLVIHTYEGLIKSRETAKPVKTPQQLLALPMYADLGGKYHFQYFQKKSVDHTDGLISYYDEIIAKLISELSKNEASEQPAESAAFQQQEAMMRPQYPMGGYGPGVFSQQMGARAPTDRQGMIRNHISSRLYELSRTWDFYYRHGHLPVQVVDAIRGNDSYTRITIASSALDHYSHFQFDLTTDSVEREYTPTDRKTLRANIVNDLTEAIRPAEFNSHVTVEKFVQVDDLVEIFNQTLQVAAKNEEFFSNYARKMIQSFRVTR